MRVEAMTHHDMALIFQVTPPNPVIEPYQETPIRKLPPYFNIAPRTRLGLSNHHTKARTALSFKLGFL
jgi:hypothetical protein